MIRGLAVALNKMMLKNNKTIESLRSVNKQIRVYTREGKEHSMHGDKTGAKSIRIKMKALRRLKADVLERLYQDGAVEAIEAYDVDGEQYWCWSLTIDNQSYRCPVGRLLIDRDADIVDIDLEEPKEPDMSTEKALKHLQNEFRLSANEYLEETHVRFPTGKYFTGWKCLQ